MTDTAQGWLFVRLDRRGETPPGRRLPEPGPAAERPAHPRRIFSRRQGWLPVASGVVT